MCMAPNRWNGQTYSQITRWNDILDAVCNIGYWKIRIAAKERGKTVLAFHYEIFWFPGKPFGLCHAPVLLNGGSM